MKKQIKYFRDDNFGQKFSQSTLKKRTLKLNSFIPLSFLYTIPKDSILQFSISDTILLAIGLISLALLLLFKRFFVNKTTNNK